MQNEKIEILYKPMPKQEEFEDSLVPITGFMGGVGSGKTKSGIIKCIKYMLRYPGTFGMITAPTYPMLRDATMRTFFEMCPEGLIRKYNKADSYVELTNGSAFVYRSADEPEHLRGPNLHWCYADEIALMTRTAYHIILARIRAPDAPNLFWFSTTPKGFNWVYDEFVKKKNDKITIIRSSSRDNIYLKPEYVQLLEATYSSVFAKQEIEGEFVGFEGLVYPIFNRLTHVISKDQIKDKRFKQYIVGVDWGWTNPTALVLVGIDNDGVCYIIKEHYAKNILLEDLVKIAHEWKAEYQIEYFVADPSKPEHILIFNKSGLNCREANNEVLAGIDRVANKIEKKQLFVTENCVDVIMEFENYRFPEKKEGKPVQENPLKIFDHSMDALRYVIMSLGEGESRVIEGLDLRTTNNENSNPFQFDRRKFFDSYRPRF